MCSIYIDTYPHSRYSQKCTQDFSLQYVIHFLHTDPLSQKSDKTIMVFS